jgi:PEGA domain
MKRNAWLLGTLAGAALLTGCVERRYVITSDPPGALVLRSGQPLGATPADDHFVYYGNYHFTLIRDGYETLEVDQPIPPPWYQWPGLDFVSENLIPWRIYDVRRFHYQLQPLQVPNSVDVLNRAQELRGRGQQLGPLPGTEPVQRRPAPPPGAVPVPVAAPVPPAVP